MSLKLKALEKNSDDDGDDLKLDTGDKDIDDGDDGAHLSKLISSKLRAREKDNDDDDEDDSKLDTGDKDSDDGDDDDDGDGTRLSKLLSSKLKVRDKGDDDGDHDGDDDDSRLSKLMSSKLSVSDKESDDDDKAKDSDKEVTEDENSDKKSKLPSRFKPPALKDAEKNKKNRFGRHRKYSKHVKAKHKRWLKNSS